MMIHYAEVDEYDEFFYEEDGDEPYQEIRAALAPEYQDLSPDDIEALFATMGISAEDMEFSLRNAFKSIGRVAQQVAPTALPIVGTAVGTAVGGPVGAALGGMAGRAAGGLISQAGRQRRPPRRPVQPGRVRQPAAPLATAPRPPGAGSPAAAQLLQAISRPEVLQGLIGMALGRAGQKNIGVSNTRVPTGAIGNLLSVLANQASAEYNSSVSYDGETVPSYLLGMDGELLVDPAVPEERAGRLIQLLDQAAWERAILNESEEDLFYEIDDDELDWSEDDYYDQLDLIDFYVDEEWEA